MKYKWLKAWLVAAAFLTQQSWMIGVAQVHMPDVASGRVPGSLAASSSSGTPANDAQEEVWDRLGKSGTTIMQPGRADGMGKPALGGERRPLYRLNKSDVVEITFNFATEFNQTATVQPDGFIRLKQAGSIYAEGCTLPELEQAVRQAYAVDLHEPRVSISLKEFDKPFFIAGGEVARPGKYEIRSSTTISEALAIAGGFTHDGKHSQVLLLRRVDDNSVEARVVNVKKMLSKGQLSEDWHLHPGDMLYVPQNTMSKVRRYLPVPSLGTYFNPSQF